MIPFMNRFFMYAISLDIDFCIDLCIFILIPSKCRPQLIRIPDWGDNSEDHYLELTGFFIRKVNFAFQLALVVFIICMTKEVS